MMLSVALVPALCRSVPGAFRLGPAREGHPCNASHVPAGIATMTAAFVLPGFMTSAKVDTSPQAVPSLAALSLPAVLVGAAGIAPGRRCGRGA